MHLIEDSVPNPWLVGLVRNAGPRWRLIVASLHHAGDLQDEIRAAGVEAAAVGATGWRGHPAAVSRLLGLIRRYRVDIVHAHNFSPSLVTMLAALVDHSFRWIYTYFPPVDFFRLAPTKRWKRAVLVAIDRQLMFRAHAVVAPSRHVRDMLRREGVPAARVHEIPVGFDVGALLRRASERGDEAASDLGRGGGFRALTAARLAWEKDHETLLRAWQLFVREHATAGLLLVGQGPLRASIQERARELGISDSVRLLGQRRDLPALMLGSDAVVHTALTESYGLVLAEALALERPLVTTNVGVAYHLEHGTHCLKVPFKDSVAVRDALHRIATDRQFAGALASRGADLIRRDFAIERNALRFEELYAGLSS